MIYAIYIPANWQLLQALSEWLKFHVYIQRVSFESHKISITLLSSSQENLLDDI